MSITDEVSLQKCASTKMCTCHSLWLFYSIIQLSSISIKYGKSSIFSQSILCRPKNTVRWTTFLMCCTIFTVHWLKKCVMNLHLWQWFPTNLSVCHIFSRVVQQHLFDSMARASNIYYLLQMNCCQDCIIAGSVILNDSFHFPVTIDICSSRHKHSMSTVDNLSPAHCGDKLMKTARC